MSKLDLATEIELALLTSRFRIRNSDAVPSGHKLQLWVGPTITIYTNGTVLVQGVLKPKFAWCKQKLARILPTDTRWQLDVLS
ncbi:hypothetical protein Q9Q94_06170 [Uliginosibacterium sp. 31-16]|uniref:hypothetical protein n=1 Tax=Uliginosibacterium sp. 31-16 TaxID=3068315 RepID=UPI00273D0122|nr:hypothetical protein [Uliginosibacterium sp. 31-16]MDP5239108.1 hypothetical protein [Uliginosibacterium sp. 31-16]